MKKEKKPMIRPIAFPVINTYKLRKKLGVKADGSYSDKQLQRALEMIMEEIFHTYAKSYITQKLGDVGEDGIAFTYKSHDCYLTVNIWHCNITYTVRLTTEGTENVLQQKDVCYFAKNHMRCYPETLLFRVLRDFSELVYEVANLVYTYKWCEDKIPNGCYLEDDIWFENEHERRILKPRHYYTGDIDYNNGNKTPVPYPFEEWYHEIMSDIHLP